MPPLPLTIVIPTHKRHYLLGKTLAYYDAFGLPVLVVDSTPEPFTGLAGLRNVEYLHRPDEPLPHKMRAPILERVNTPYMVMSADDMFLSLEAVAECVSFLEGAPDFVSAQGCYFGMPMDGNSEGLRALYVNAQNFDNTVDAPTSEGRMLQLFSRYVPTFYAVSRTECWKWQMYAYPDAIRNYCLLEFFFAMAVAIAGKHRILPITYAITYMAPTVNGLDPVYRNDLHELATQERYVAEYAAFEDGAAALLCEVSGRSAAHSHLFVHKAVAMQAWKRKPDRTVGEKLRRELSKFLTKFFDSAGLKARRKARQTRECKEIAEEYHMLRRFVGPEGEERLRALLLAVEPRAAVGGK